MSNLSIDWHPACSLTAMRQRAQLMHAIRGFFYERQVLEVDTPVLGHGTVTEPHLSALTTDFCFPGSDNATTLYLQTSPEFAMKRLLASGSGSIYQICKAFRNKEYGRYHNPEFTLLEWYRVGYSLFDLISEIEALFVQVSKEVPAMCVFKRYSYQEVFEKYTGVNPFTAEVRDFSDCASCLGFSDASSLCGEDITTWLDFLFSHAIQPYLGQGNVTFVYHYPSVLPSLARSLPDEPRKVERVELFFAGVELGNGFRELTDAQEQAKRFDNDIKVRRERGDFFPSKDERLLAALQSGLPDCAGIAIGLDRLLLCLTGTNTLEKVLAFPIQRA